MQYFLLGPLIAIVVATLIIAVAVGVTSLGRVPGLVTARRIASVLFAGSVIALLFATFAGAAAPSSPAQSVAVNLRPGADIVAILRSHSQHLILINIVGNVVMYAVPCALLAFLVGPRRTVRIVVGAACISVGLEAIQHGIGRSADIDDVLLNTLGSLTGAVVGRVVAAHIMRTRR